MKLDWALQILKKEVCCDNVEFCTAECEECKFYNPANDVEEAIRIVVKYFEDIEGE